MQPYPVTMSVLPRREAWIYDDPAGGLEQGSEERCEQRVRRVAAIRPWRRRTGVRNSLHFRAKGHLSRESAHS
jgi:hypothetical protein